jgi:hypothetical protein
MRRIVVLGVLLAMMLAITALQTSQSAAHDPMTLAAIGFVILAAYTVSEVGSLLQLPQVTGYIVAGLALGPAAANILSSEVVVEMKMFNTLALGLIATGAGLELDVSRLRRVWKTLIATVGVKVILSGSFVIATLLAVQTALGSLELGSKAELISLSLVLGVLSLTTSPAIVMAVLNETKSKGRMTDLALGAAVLKDLVVVTLLALVVAVSRTLLAPNAEVDARVIINVGKEIASSIAAGGVLGVLLILYIRYVRAEMLLFVAAMILVSLNSAVPFISKSCSYSSPPVSSCATFRTMKKSWLRRFLSCRSPCSCCFSPMRAPVSTCEPPSRFFPSLWRFAPREPSLFISAQEQAAPSARKTSRSVASPGWATSHKPVSLLVW